jgi:hypothetical protein
MALARCGLARAAGARGFPRQSWSCCLARGNPGTPFCGLPRAIALAPRPTGLFQAAAPPAEVADLGRATWTFGPPDGPEAVRGMDIGIISDGQIATMYTIVEPAP